LTIGLGIILVTTGYIFYIGTEGGFAYYYTVDEFFDNNIVDKLKSTPEPIRLAGRAENIKLHTANKNRIAEFVLIGQKHQISVIYKGRMPDNFQKNRIVVVQGSKFENGRFAADKLLTKCESKYRSKLQSDSQVGKRTNEKQ
jgi:cytochrome c-type biogenesis protein CcmE